MNSQKEKLSLSDKCEDRILPPGFEDLEPFIDDWALQDSHERWMFKSASSMKTIKRFYDAVVPRAEDIISHVDEHPLDALPPPSHRLFLLLLALPHAAMAIEVHSAPRAPRSPWPHRVVIERGPQPVS
mgnify:CR=1 FL=1